MNIVYQYEAKATFSNELNKILRDLHLFHIFAIIKK